jgi:DNA helicase HerA-like ATPase
MTPNSADVLDAVIERHLGVLGKTGSGKTYAAKGIVERLLQRRRRIFDPTSFWWGLKATADGGASPLPVAVLGGDRGDLPLEESMGEAAAAAVVRLTIALVLDLSSMTHAARIRFLTDYFAALFRSNRDILHLVPDEAGRSNISDQLRGFSLFFAPSC